VSSSALNSKGAVLWVHRESRGAYRRLLQMFMEAVTVHVDYILCQSSVGARTRLDRRGRVRHSNHAHL
jgi:hypothetical protein